MADSALIDVDFLEAGTSRPHVMLVHSSVSGARQWRRLMDDMKDRFRIRAVNLYGYGKTPSWHGGALQTLDDQARLVETAIPADADELYVVGHSFGGSVAMKLAANLKRRVTKLVLLETNPFHLLAQARRIDAFAEAEDLCNCIRTFGARGEWRTAAEMFADYWSGAGTWRNMPEDRRAVFAAALRPNLHEWSSVMNEATTLDEWADMLPRATMALCDPETVLPIREIDTLLRSACPDWTFGASRGGHMAPLTRPDLINPIVTLFLSR